MNETFALSVQTATGHSDVTVPGLSSETVNDLIRSVLRSQHADGAWRFPDELLGDWAPGMTGVAVRALARLRYQAGDIWTWTDGSGGVQKALDYLASRLLEAAPGADLWDECQMVTALARFKRNGRSEEVADRLVGQCLALCNDDRNKNSSWFGPAFYAAALEVAREFPSVRDREKTVVLGIVNKLKELQAGNGSFPGRSTTVRRTAWHTALVLRAIGDDEQYRKDFGAPTIKKATVWLLNCCKQSLMEDTEEDSRAMYMARALEGLQAVRTTLGSDELSLFETTQKTGGELLQRDFLLSRSTIKAKLAMLEYVASLGDGKSNWPKGTVAEIEKRARRMRYLQSPWFGRIATAIVTAVLIALATGATTSQVNVYGQVIPATIRVGLNGEALVTRDDGRFNFEVTRVLSNRSIVFLRGDERICVVPTRNVWFPWEIGVIDFSSGIDRRCEEFTETLTN